MHPFLPCQLKHTGPTATGAPYANPPSDVSQDWLSSNDDACSVASSFGSVDATLTNCLDDLFDILMDSDPEFQACMVSTSLFETPKLSTAQSECSYSPAEVATQQTARPVSVPTTTHAIASCIEILQTGNTSRDYAYPDPSQFSATLGVPASNSLPTYVTPTYLGHHMALSQEPAGIRLQAPLPPAEGPTLTWLGTFQGSTTTLDSEATVTDMPSGYPHVPERPACISSSKPQCQPFVKRRRRHAPPAMKCSLHKRRRITRLRAEKDLITGVRKYRCEECSLILEKWVRLIGSKPTSEQKDAILKEVGMSRQQVHNWFSNRRREEKALSSGQAYAAAGTI